MDMQTYIYQFSNLPSLLILNESKLDTFKSGILKDIQYESGFKVDDYRFTLIGNRMLLSIELPLEKVNLITCALRNLQGAEQLFNS